MTFVRCDPTLKWGVFTISLFKIISLIWNNSSDAMGLGMWFGVRGASDRQRWSRALWAAEGGSHLVLPPVPLVQKPLAQAAERGESFGAE
jgi:hypothetical protein